MLHETPQTLMGVLTGEPVLVVVDVGRYRFTVTFEPDPTLSGAPAAAAVGAAGVLVLLGPLAERAFTQFTAGDRFLAAGTTTSGEPGMPVEFVARHIGHDLSQRRYAVDRTRRRGTAHRTPQPPVADPRWSDRVLRGPACDRPDTDGPDAS